MRPCGKRLVPSVRELVGTQLALGQDINCAGPLQGTGSDELLAARVLARDDQRRGGGGHQLAGGVVTAHGDHGAGAGDQMAEPGQVAMDDDPGTGARAQAGQSVLAQLRAGDDQVPMPRWRCHGHGGPQQRQAIGAPTGGGEHVGLGGRARIGIEQLPSPGKVSGEGGPLVQGRGDLPGDNRVVDRGVAVDPDGVDEPAQGIGRSQGLPFGGRSGRVVEHLAQSEHHLGVGDASAQQAQRGLQFPVNAQGVPVDDDQVGFESLQRGGHHARAEAHQGLRIGAQAPWEVTGRGFGEPGENQPVESFWCAGSGLGSDARQQQSGHRCADDVRQIHGEPVGYGEIAARVPHAE